jgi:hypothetical protein
MVRTTWAAMLVESCEVHELNELILVPGELTSLWLNLLWPAALSALARAFARFFLGRVE